MKAAFRTIAAAAIIGAAVSPAMAQAPEFSIVTDGSITSEQVKSNAAKELRWLSKEVSPDKYSVLIQTYTPETAPAYLDRKHYVVVSLLDKKTTSKPLTVRFDGPLMTEGGTLALVRKGINSITEDVTFNDGLKQRL